MEILNWFMFFGIMIFLSLFSWLQIFGLFIMSIVIINCFANYSNIVDKTDLNSIIQKTVVNSLKLFYNTVKKVTKTLINTKYGVFLFKKLQEFEVAYQNSKGLIKQEVMKMMLSSNSRNFTPRVSHDDDETDDEE